MAVKNPLKIQLKHNSLFESEIFFTNRDFNQQKNNYNSNHFNKRKSTLLLEIVFCINNIKLFVFFISSSNIK